MNLHLLNWVDYIVIGIIGFSLVISLVRGFVREALSLATWIIAFWVALTFAEDFSHYFQALVNSTSMAFAAAFIVLLIVTLILGGLVNFLISQLVSRTGLGGTDRLLGMIFGAGRGILLVALLILAAKLTSFTTSASWQQSQLIPHFAPVEAWLIQFIPDDFQLQKSNLSLPVDSLRQCQQGG